MLDRLCLLSVHAHPDDESSKGAGTVARYHAEGVHTVLVTCTGGEEGEILNPAVDSDETRANLVNVRRRELDHAAEIIGYDEVVMLGYRDSGMEGSPANADPRSFAAAPLDEAVGRLVEVIRRVRPQVVITYEAEQSRYRHPDHLRVNEISEVAFERAGDPQAYPGLGEPYEPLKLYYTGWSKDRARRRHEKFLELGLDSPYDSPDGWPLDPEDSEEPISTTIDLRGYEHVRFDALRAHATQVDPNSPHWFGLPAEVEHAIHSTDVFVLARSRVGPIGPEDDLFAGIREKAGQSTASVGDRA